MPRDPRRMPEGRPNAEARRPRSSTGSRARWMDELAKPSLNPKAVDRPWRVARYRIAAREAKPRGPFANWAVQGIWRWCARVSTPVARRAILEWWGESGFTTCLNIVPIRLMQVATECSLYVRSKGVLFPPLRIGRETGHERLVDVPRALPRRGIMHPGLGGSTLAVWVCVRPLRAPAGLSAQGAGARLRMRGLRSSRVGDGGNHLPPHPHTVAQMVPGGVVDGAGQARGLGPVPGARAGASL